MLLFARLAGVGRVRIGRIRSFRHAMQVLYDDYRGFRLARSLFFRREFTFFNSLAGSPAAVSGLLGC
jgi:hypothetical protein